MADKKKPGRRPVGAERFTVRLRPDELRALDRFVRRCVTKRLSRQAAIRWIVGQCADDAKTPNAVWR